METVDWSEIPLETAMNFWRAALGSDWVHCNKVLPHERLWKRLYDAELLDRKVEGATPHWKIKEPTCHT